MRGEKLSHAIDGLHGESMQRFSILTFLVLAMIGYPAVAVASVSHGKWALRVSGDECQLMQMSSDEQSIIMIRLSTKGTLAVEATGANWDIGQGESVNVSLQAVGGGTRIFKAARGYLSRDGWGGFTDKVAGQFRAGFLRELQAGSVLNVMLNNKKIQSFSLQGSSSGLSALQRCSGQIILKNAQSMPATVRGKLAVFEREIAYDAENRWIFLRYDRGSVWLSELIDVTDNESIFRTHYTYNGGTAGYVDIKENRGYRSYCYWDRPNYCQQVNIYDSNIKRTN